LNPDPEFELYIFNQNSAVGFVWKYKLPEERVAEQP